MPIETSQKSSLERYVDRFPDETEPYITHCIVGGSGSSPADAKSAIKNLLVGEGGGGSVTSTDRYLLREWKSLVEWLNTCQRNTYPIRKECDSGPHEHIRGRFTTYTVDDETHIVVICRYEPTPSDHHSTKKTISDLKFLTTENPNMVFVSKLKPNGWHRPDGLNR